MCGTQITRIALVGFLVMMSACLAKKYGEESYTMPVQYDESADVGWADDESSAGNASPAPAPPPPPRTEPVESSVPESEPTQSAQQAPARMVHYDGHARMRVTNVDDLLKEIEEVAVESGGRVDRLYGNTITIRVPVGEFDATWKTLLDLGDVLSRSVRADDISAQFMAVDLRVKTLRTTLNRLIELLAKAVEEEEKLALLQQITRVTEQLDQFESQLRTLSDLAAMSRITIEAIPREQYASQRRGEYDGFYWVSQISPFRRAVFEDDHRIALPNTDGLVTLSTKGPFVAESPDGTVLWTQRMENDPKGGGAFWVAALADRLDGQFTGYDTSAIGSWSCLGLDEAGADEPYHWQICVQPDGKHLNVSQAFFPDPDQWARYGPRIAGALSFGGES